MTWWIRTEFAVYRGAWLSAALLVLVLVPALANAQRDAGRIDPMLLTLPDLRRGFSRPRPVPVDVRLSFSEGQGRVAVTLIAAAARAADDLEWRVEELEQRVNEEGGIVTARFENVVFADVPIDQIERFVDEDALHYMTAQARFTLPPDEAEFESLGVTEDGVGAINVQRLHAAGITGEGVKVGILDFGFQGYDALVRRGELPRAVAQRAFNRTGGLENGKVHGTACAEIIHDVAPGAQLYLASVNGYTDELENAMNWLAKEQGVDIINFSGGGHNGPHNGTAILDRMVDRIVADTGVLWVNAAGNEGAKHWSGLAGDADGNGWIELDGEWLAFTVRPEGGEVTVQISWDDWGANPQLPMPTEDIDAFLYEFDSQDMRLVAKSERPQRGRGTPIEWLMYQRARPGRQYDVFLRATRVTRPDLRVHVFNQTSGAMMPATPSGSIGIPATARSALAVGAVDVTSGRLETFSSQGPTDDGRIKPEVSAPDNTQSLAYEGLFSGTSAACAHVSGFAALLKGIHPAADREELTVLVLRYVRPMGRVTPNNQYGHGHIDASKIEISPLGGVPSEVGARPNGQ